MSEEYERGFNDGIAWAMANYNVATGKMKLPESFVHRGGLYNAGFGEGCLTGRIKKKYGDRK